MRTTLLTIALLLAFASASLADNKILWQPEGVDCGGGGWWFSEQLTTKLDGYGNSGMPGDVLEELVSQAVPNIKRATIQLNQRKYRWYWLGFRFSRSDVKALRVNGPGALLLEFVDPGNPSNKFVTTDWGMLVSCDQQMNCFNDTAGGTVDIKPIDRRGVLKVWCLVRLPKQVDGRELDRICMLTSVQPVKGKWEVIK